MHISKYRKTRSLVAPLRRDDNLPSLVEGSGVGHLLHRDDILLTKGVTPNTTPRYNQTTTQRPSNGGDACPFPTISPYPQGFSNQCLGQDRPMQ